MKPLDPETLIEMLPATPDDIERGLLTFEHVAPVEFRSPGFIRYAIKEGWTRPEVVGVDGRRQYLITWHPANDGGFFVDIAQSLAPGGNIGFICAAMDGLAARQRAPYIRFATKRRGLARAVAPYGYTPEAVLCVKGLATA